MPITTSLGRVGMVLKGTYNSATQYQRLDVVTYNNGSYVAKQSTKGNAPTSTTYWQPIADISGVVTSANNAANAATTAAASANTATTNANNAAAAATTATNNANTATTKANIAASSATNAATSATSAATSATNAASSANTAASKANTATTNANTATSSANTAATSATNAANAANTAATKANTAATAANNAANAVKYAVNPNLLYNPYFIGGGVGSNFPVNQRGKTSYSTTSGVIYGCDGWAHLNVSLSQELTADYMKLKTTALPSGYPTLAQRFENSSKFNGKTLTFSVLMKRTSTQQFTIALKDVAVGGSGFTFVNATAPVGQWELVTCTGVAYDSVSTLQAVMIFILPSQADEVHIKAAKLELGDAQTLAHKDANGEWVLNEIPNYSVELYKSQRYYLRYSGTSGSYNHIFMGMDANSNVLYFTVQLPTPMRTTPAIAHSALSNFFAYNANRGEVAVTNIAIHSCDASPGGVKWVSLAVTISSVAVKGEPYLLRMRSAGYIEFIASV